MSPELQVIIFLLSVVASGVVFVYIVMTIISLYNVGVRKLFTLNKKRRITFNNITEHIHKHPSEWRINTSEHNVYGFDSVDVSDEHDIKIVFKHNIITNSEYKKNRHQQTSDAHYLMMSLEERIKMKRAYKFLVKWNANKDENESVDKFYISSTGFDKL